MNVYRKAGMLLAAFVLAFSGLLTAAPASAADEMTRGEFVKSLVGAMDLPLKDGTSITFTDVDDDLAPYVEAAFNLQLTKGKSTERFAPDEMLTREQGFAIAARAVETEEVYPISILSKFKDGRYLSMSLREDLAEAAGIGLLLGYSDGTVKPSRGISAGEMSAIITRTLREYTPVDSADVALRILGTSDLHTNFVNYDYYQDRVSNSLGLAKTALLIEEARTENPNSLLFDNGDLIQGTPFGSYKVSIAPLAPGEIHPAVAALSALDFDATTLGNHEFNFGLDYLDEVIDDSPFPFLNANVYDAATGENRYEPYTIIDKEVTDGQGDTHTIQVGVIGVVAPQIMKWDRANLEGKVTADDAVETVEKFLPEVEAAGADVVVVLSHSGMGDEEYEIGEENITYQLTEIDGIDAIITGHNHDQFPGSYGDLAGVDQEQGTINGTPVVMPGKFGSHLGVIDLKLAQEGEEWEVVSQKAQLRAIDTESGDVDQRVIDAVKEAHEGTIEYVNSPVGETTAPITSYFALVKDDPSIQIVTNAQLWYAQQQLAGTEYEDLPLLSAGAPFKAGGRNGADYYTEINTGEIAIKNVADLYVYDNTMFVLRVTGDSLKDWLEMAAGQFNQIDPAASGEQNLINQDFRTYNFDVIDGVTYEIDVTEPAKYSADGELLNENANRIKNLMYEGEPVTDDQEFLVVTNNHRASGNFPGVVDALEAIDFAYENRQAVQDYMVAEGTINPTADENWTFAPISGSPDIVFETSGRAQPFIPEDGSIEHLSDLESGFAKYRLIFE